jgi:protein CsiD
MSSVGVESKYKIVPHLGHKRLHHIELENKVITDFLESVSDINVQRIEYVPFMRFHLSKKLIDLLGVEFQNEIRGLLNDRKTGGFTIGLQGQTSESDDYVKFSTAVSHLIGMPNFDSMSGKYYARFSVEHSDSSDTFLRKAYTTVKLHTDGSFLSEATDWLLMMKFEERNAIGGESRFLHLDDWNEIDEFLEHPLVSHQFKFSYADRKSKNVDEEVNHVILYKRNNLPCIRYNHQAMHPTNIYQAEYLKQIQDSIENTNGTISVKLSVGDLVMLNNHFWLHGREPFEVNSGLHRELLRQRGVFSES